MEILSQFNTELSEIYKRMRVNSGVPYTMNHLKTIYDKYNVSKRGDCCGNQNAWLQRLAAWYMQTLTQPVEEHIEEPQTIAEIVKSTKKKK